MKPRAPPRSHVHSRRSIGGRHSLMLGDWFMPSWWLVRWLSLASLVVGSSLFHRATRTTRHQPRRMAEQFHRLLLKRIRRLRIVVASGQTHLLCSGSGAEVTLLAVEFQSERVVRSVHKRRKVLYKLSRGKRTNFIGNCGHHSDPELSLESEASLLLLAAPPLSDLSLCRIFRPLFARRRPGPREFDLRVIEG